MTNQVNFERVEGMWRAYLADATHCGGMGNTPEEALGFLCLNHPQRMQIDCFSWIHRPPQLPGHPAETYPQGPQPAFDHCLNCLKPLPEDHTDLNGTPKGPICPQCEAEENEDEQRLCKVCQAPADDLGQCNNRKCGNYDGVS